MNAGRVILRGGHIISMDATIGNLPSGDLLIEDGKIVAIAPSLGDIDAEVVDVSGHIVAPGLIDTHRHTWQTQMRAVCADWSLADYVFGMRLTVSPSYEPEDVHIGNHLGAVEALNSGVTTILDFSHCNNTPDHTDAAIAGLRSAGGRAVFGYGFFDSEPMSPRHFATHDARLEDFYRIAEDSSFSNVGGLLSLGASMNEIGSATLEMVDAEIRAARSRGAIQALHTSCVWSFPSEIPMLAEAGLLGPDQVHIHCNAVTNAGWKLMADAGCKVSTSVETELNMGMGRPVFAAAKAHGIKPTLSSDIVSLNSGDLFAQMRQALGFARWADTESTNLAGGDPVKVTVSTHEALEWATINGADALGQADRIGSLTPGKEADIIVIGGPAIAQHPVLDAEGTLVFQTTTADVRHVLVSGRFVKRDGHMVGVDLRRLIQGAEDSAGRVMDRVAARTPEFPPTPALGIAALAQ